MDNPCLRCGACCAWYRVSFYWSESETFLGGGVPPELTEALNPWRAAMRGTTCPPLRCVALEGNLGEAVCCAIYLQRPSPCRELEPWNEDGSPNERCTKARAGHGLPPLDPRTDRPPGHAPLPLRA